MDIKKRTSEIAKRIIIKSDEDILKNVDQSKEILSEINQLVDQTKNNKSEMLEEILTCQIYLLNLLFKNQIEHHLAIGENGLKIALAAQRQSLTAIRALKKLKTPTMVDQPTKRALVEQLGEDMSHNSYQKLINSPEYLDAK